MRAVILLLLTIALTVSDPASCRRGNSQSETKSAEKRTPSPERATEAANTSQEDDPFAAIPRIKVEDLARAMKEERVVVVDIREVEDYEEEHIKGAVSIPLEQIRERGPKELPTARLIVTYCA
jgi:hypothetical protein